MIDIFLCAAGLLLMHETDDTATRSVGSTLLAAGIIRLAGSAERKGA